MLAIGQPSHAWISGQLARAWGNERFGAVEPLEEVCLAAEQHDVGWADRDLEPLYNPKTGLPRAFMEMPLEIHLRLFTAGPRSARVSEPLRGAARLAAWLAALRPPRPRPRVGGRRRGDPKLSRRPARVPGAADRVAARRPSDIGERHRRDDRAQQPPDLDLGLHLAGALPRLGSRDGEGVSDRRERGRSRHKSRPRARTPPLEPWPFAAPSLTVRCEGRRLEHRYDDEDAMRAALAAAPWETLELRLEPR